MQVSVQPSRQAVCIYTSVCEHVNKRPHTLSSFNVRLAGVFQNRQRRLVRGAANEKPPSTPSTSHLQNNLRAIWDPAVARQLLAGQ